MYECERCHKQLSSKARLDYHLSNKVCFKTNRMCFNCGQTFATKRGLEYHRNNHVCERRKPKPKLTLKTRTSYREMSRDELISELTELKGKYKSLRENPQTVNNVVIFPTAFGREDMDYVKTKLGDFMRPLIVSHPRKSIPCLFNQIHNNKQLPEYHNIYTTSERSNYALVSDGESFKYTPKKTVIDQIIEDKRSLLNQYVDDNGDQLGERVLQKYERYQDDIDTDSEFKKQLEIEIGGLLLNMKSVIANDEKTRRLLDKVDEGQFELSPDDQKE